MTLNRIIEEFLHSTERPNKFTIGMGKLIQQARKDAGLSQRGLSQKIFVRQATISDIENGRTEPDAQTLMLLASRLDKPLSYFFPDPYNPDRRFKEEVLSELEKELLLQAHKLEKDDLRKLIVQAKALVDFEEKEFFRQE